MRLLFLDRPSLWRRVMYRGSRVAFWGFIVWYAIALLRVVFAGPFSF